MPSKEVAEIKNMLRVFLILFVAICGITGIIFLLMQDIGFGTIMIGIAAGLFGLNYLIQRHM